VWLPVWSDVYRPADAIAIMSCFVKIYIGLTWLMVAERIDFNLAVLVYKCLHGAAPSYLADELCLSADLSPRRRLRSAPSSSLVVRRTRLSTIGDRAFPVAAAHVWNGLPQHVTSAPSLSTFRRRLKTHLFQRCFP